MLDDALGVPAASSWGIQLVNQLQVVPPRQFANDL